MFSLLGTIGNALFCWACISMALATVKRGRDIGTPLSTMWTFLFANASFGAYLFGTFGLHLLFVVSLVETACWLIALWYHYRPRMPVGFALIGFCKREDRHEGPCNGWPRETCPGGDDHISP